MHRQDSRRALIRATRLLGLQERFVEAKGARLRYFARDGEGVPVVLVHGLSGAACNWASVLRLLPVELPVLAPELPGHGGSSPLPAVSSLEAFADRLLMVVRREALARALLVGHSLGALVALRMAHRSPASVRGVLLVGAAGISSTRRRAEKALKVSALVKPGRMIAPYRAPIARRPVLRRLVLQWGAADTDALTPDAAERFLIGPALHSDTASAAEALVADDVREHLAGVRCPCLVLWGARDTQVAVGDAFEFSRRLGARVRVVADCGHLLPGERADVCATAIAEFADSMASSGAPRAGRP